MANLKTRETVGANCIVVGAPLTWAEVDTNFINLNDDLALKATLISPALVTPALGTPASGDLRNCSLAVPPAIGGTTPAAGTFTTLKATTGAAAGDILISDAVGALSYLAAGATTSILVGGGAANPVWTTATGSGSPVRATSPVLVTPALGTPASGDLRNCSLAVPPAIGGTTPAAGTFTTLKATTGAAAGDILISDAVGALSYLAAGATTSILVGGGAANPVWTTATGSGSPVRATSPVLVTPALGTPASGNLSNCTFPSGIARTDAGQSFSGIQTITNITLPTNGQILLTIPTSNGNATGNTTNGFNCGYTSSAIGDLVYLDSSATWQKCDANTLLLYNGLLGIALEVKASGNALLVALSGSFVYATGFPTMTIGLVLYMSETAGVITHTAPTTTDAAVRVIGWAVHANKIFFNPSADYITKV